MKNIIHPNIFQPRSPEKKALGHRKDKRLVEKRLSAFALPGIYLDLYINPFQYSHIFGPGIFSLEEPDQICRSGIYGDGMNLHESLFFFGF